RTISDRALGDLRRRASALTVSHGLTPLAGSVTDLAGQLPLYLVPGSREFDYLRDDLPASVHYVGPCVWTSPSREPAPAWLDELPANQPLVYVSEGTINLKPRVLRAAAQGLADLPIQVILTTGRHRDPDALDLGPRPLAPNIRVVPWLSLSHLLPRLNAIVTIGGPSTLLPALNAGIPVVIVPFDWDHPETAWRVADSGAGLRLAPRDCTPLRMRDAVLRVLREPSFGARARQ